MGDLPQSGWTRPHHFLINLPLTDCLTDMRWSFIVVLLSLTITNVLAIPVPQHPESGGTVASGSGAPPPLPPPGPPGGGPPDEYVPDGEKKGKGKQKAIAAKASSKEYRGNAMYAPVEAKRDPGPQGQWKLAATVDPKRSPLPKEDAGQW